MLYLIEILHQTTTCLVQTSSIIRCILSKFYIKPQLCNRSFAEDRSCILSKFYIKPQLQTTPGIVLIRCILSKFYIKPQPQPGGEICPVVVSYRNSTSNHNLCPAIKIHVELYLIEILHQTTTLSSLYIIPLRCILSKFYIKPQLKNSGDVNQKVVSYRNSTSNHNRPNIRRKVSTVVSYRNSTSNHNTRSVIS